MRGGEVWNFLNKEELTMKCLSKAKGFTIIYLTQDSNT
jgi:hypothetical protein